MRKTIISTVLTFAILLACCLGTQSAFAAQTANKGPTYTVSSGTGKPGDDITLTLDISNNPGICTMTIWLHYAEGLTLKSASDSRLFVGGMFSGSYKLNPFGLSWDDSANFDGDNSSNGTLATVVFSIDENAAPGDYEVWLTYDYGNIYNLDLEDFECEMVAGKITVIGDICDLNQDGSVNALDISIMRKNLLCREKEYNINGDEEFDIRDLVYLSKRLT